MVEDIPFPVILTGIAATMMCFALLLRVFLVVHERSSQGLFTEILVGMFCWTALQSLLAGNGYYMETTTMPPRLFVFGVGPAVIFILTMLARPSSRAVLMQSNLTSLTLVHIVRIPVEFGLYQLAVAHAVPYAMTIEGRNPDLIMGLTAPLVAYFLIQRSGQKRFALIIWNIVGLVSLFNIVIMAIRATLYFSSVSQFDCPNTAVFFFPWILLPTFIVPAVLFAHLNSLLILFRGDK